MRGRAKLGQGVLAGDEVLYGEENAHQECDEDEEQDDYYDGEAFALALGFNETICFYLLREQADGNIE